jgi:hypothetical protein
VLPTIGVVSPHLYQSPKREALLFDAIGVLDFENHLRLVDAATAAEMEWLAARGVLLDPMHALYQDARHLAVVTAPTTRFLINSLLDLALHVALADPANVEGVNCHSGIRELLLILQENGYDTSSFDTDEIVHSAHSELAYLLRMGIDQAQLAAYVAQLRVANHVYLSRAAAAKLNAFAVADAVALVPDNFDASDLRIPRSPILNVVLSALPQPDESTSWAKILEFRQDEDARRSLRRLRRWTASLDTKLSANEVADELQASIDSYTEYMHLHEIKTRTATAQSFCIMASEVLEHLVTLKFSAAARTLFRLREGQIELLEAEMKAPGREIAYVLKVRERFESPGA